MRPCSAEHPIPKPAECRVCWLFEADPRYRQLWGGDPAMARRNLPPPAGQARPGQLPPAPLFAPPAPIIPPCPHEGPVVSWAPCGQESLHLRQCLHEQADWDLCTRGANNGAAQPCHRCRLRPLRILLTGGIGDAIALEAMMMPEERDRLTTIYYACPARAEIETIFRALPNYPRLREHVDLGTGAAVYYSRAAVEAAVGPLPPDVEDWSIATVFPHDRPYAGSSLLTHRLADLQRPPEPYVVILPASSWGGWNDRWFNEKDWQTCLDVLDKRDLSGLVIGRERWPMPEHPRLVDACGLSILESVELIKGAVGYLGIDSWASVLAAKLFPSDRIAVKSVWGHCYDWAHVYFAPRIDFDFLRRTLEEPPWA